MILVVELMCVKGSRSRRAHLGLIKEKERTSNGNLLGPRYVKLLQISSLHVCVHEANFDTCWLVGLKVPIKPQLG